MSSRRSYRFFGSGLWRGSIILNYKIFAKKGQSFELAFSVPTPNEVDKTYEEIVKKGATPIKSANDMPWNQRTAFFADPDGNIHEIFADLPRKQ
ncbi:VOC family protein [Candidatus Woesearchaeota archaeon]|nr:VOC family protein [Candidatus Woesearchaeota archaeon]